MKIEGGVKKKMNAAHKIYPKSIDALGCFDTLHKHIVGPNLNL